MICKNCGNIIDDGDQFCGECGARVESGASAGGSSAAGGVCPRCGNVSNPGDTFCGICGSMLGSSAMRQSGAPVNYAQPGDAIKSFGKQFEAPDKKKRNTPLIIAAAALGTAVLAGIVICVMLFTGRMSPKPAGGNEQTASTQTADAGTETPVPIPTVKPVPVFTTAQASSVRSTDSLGGTYSVESVLTQDPMTKWVPVKSYGSGIGQWVQINAATPQYVNGVYVLNGYHKNAETWAKNNRVRSCTITFSDGQSRDFVLSDSMDLIALDLGGEVATYSIRLTINSVYHGSAWDDTAVTYIGAY